MEGKRRKINLQGLYQFVYAVIGGHGNMYLGRGGVYNVAKLVFEENNPKEVESLFGEITEEVAHNFQGTKLRTLQYEPDTVDEKKGIDISDLPETEQAKVQDLLDELRQKCATPEPEPPEGEPSEGGTGDGEAAPESTELEPGDVEKGEEDAISKDSTEENPTRPQNRGGRPRSRR